MCEAVDPKSKPAEKPREELMDWNAYYKNRGLISTRLGSKKAEYMHCSTDITPEKKGTGPSCCCSSCPVKDRSNYIPKCPGPGQKGKPNREYMRCFATNMVVLRLDMPGWEFECRDRLKLKANVCRKVKLCLDASRINVNELPAEVMKTFQMEPECLARQLDEGIGISLVYMGKEIGRGCYEVPKAVINRMVNQFDEIVHDANIELTCRCCTVGLVHIRFSMIMRCQTLKEVAVERLAGGQEWGCGLAERKRKAKDSNVNPQDLAFMAEGSYTSSSSLDPCAGFLPSDMDIPSMSSLEENVHHSSQDPQPQLIDMAGPFPVYSCPKGDDVYQDVTIEPPAGPSAQFSPEQQHFLGDGSTNRLGQKLSSPKLLQMHISGTRTCILCGEDVSWLPKVAACPYCGYKAVPEFKEREYDENATARQILLDHLENPVEELSFDLGSVEGCSGDGGLDYGTTSEAFEAVVREYQALKRSIRQSQTKACESVTQKQTNMAVSGDQLQGKSRPQDLVKIFAELKELFKVNEVQDERQNMQEICKEACKLAKGKKSKSRLAEAASKTNAVPSEPKDACEVPKKKKRRRTIKRSTKSRYYSMYSPQNRIKIRQDSIPPDERVPAHMGWLWTAHPLASKPGWRPGAIRRSIRQLMCYFLKDYPLDTIPVSKYMSYYNHKKPPTLTPVGTCEDLVQVPTLHIEKKHDVYTITLRPLKNGDTLARSANPYLDMKPVQFRIVKDPLMKELRDMKRCLKNMGFSKCTCHKPVMHCYCRSFVDKKLLVQRIREECERRHIDPCEDDLVLSETSDSEAEFEFGVTPPAGLMRPDRFKSSHIKHTETQYDESDWAMPSQFPHPPHPEVQYASCVMGERKKPFNWVYGKGVIQEEPKPPKMRNIPKKGKKKKVEPGRVAGGFAGHEYQDSSIYSRLNNNSPPRRLITPENLVPPNYSTDSELPLSGEHMRRLDQAAYPPTAPQRREPWALELEKERQRRRVKRRAKKLVRFDPSIGPHSSDSYDP
ncbi:uncharacterized protein Ppi1 [Drosophila kikkawai]|uniref:Uncharacterized protein Ppi1 n=1 Tax=Drosophila kikkawai TaxID=30033 RepID=A0A6P4JBE1_DROKI|nr:uncharacterized protein LOC108085913 [Drosophila kikkawai]